MAKRWWLAPVFSPCRLPPGEQRKRLLRHERPLNGAGHLPRLE
jgi:hypothetical protein